MNTLQKALQEYLAMRHALGFQLLDAGPALSDFVSFLKRRRTSHITIRLALEWAQKPGAQPARWAHRLGFVRGFADIGVLRTLGRRFHPGDFCLFDQNGLARPCTQTVKCACC